MTHYSHHKFVCAEWRISIYGRNAEESTPPPTPGRDGTTPRYWVSWFWIWTSLIFRILRDVSNMYAGMPVHMHSACPLWSPCCLRTALTGEALSAVAKWSSADQAC